METPESPPEKPFLETERQNTDESLNAERHKTNESLNDIQTKTENKTDSVVHSERVLADSLTASSRNKADATIEKKSDSSANDKNAHQEAQQVQNERRSADQATQQERARTNAAIVKEREIKENLMTQLLEQEREKTDENLSVERTRTDSTVEKHTTQLSTEISEHLKTKTSLTSRDEFLAIVSHDLKNPIGVASSCAALLLEDEAFKGMDPEIRSGIELIKRNNDIALRLIADLLDMERVAQGKLQIKLGRHDVGQMIREILENHALLAASKSIVLRLLPSDLSEEITCDKDRIIQIMSNLIGNAIKFTPKGGTVTVNVSFSESEIKFSVSDTGPGIPDEMKGKIFERFVQLTSSSRKGLGLGLHISKMLAEAHQGNIWVESKLGQGSTFFFTIPRDLKN